jgi:cell fate (sporulation/competence/biofilm development) regulator YlbF (YheA/YmcA/DUF963 family)
VDIDEIMKLRERLFDLIEEKEDLQDGINELSDEISEAIDELSDEDRDELEALIDEEEDEEGEDEED